MIDGLTTACDFIRVKGKGVTRVKNWQMGFSLFPSCSTSTGTVEKGSQIGVNILTRFDLHKCNNI